MQEWKPDALLISVLVNYSPSGSHPVQRLANTVQLFPDDTTWPLTHGQLMKLAREAGLGVLRGDLGATTEGVKHDITLLGVTPMDQAPAECYEDGPELDYTDPVTQLAEQREREEREAEVEREARRVTTTQQNRDAEAYRRAQRVIGERLRYDSEVLATTIKGLDAPDSLAQQHRAGALADAARRVEASRFGIWEEVTPTTKVPSGPITYEASPLDDAAGIGPAPDERQRSRFRREQRGGWRRRG